MVILYETLQSDCETFDSQGKAKHRDIREAVPVVSPVRLMRTVIIDNYDSFTFNLYQMVAELAQEAPLVVRNDELDWAGFAALEADCVILSPGPGRPDRRADFGVSADILQRSNVPTLGVCLGHQGISHAFGGQLIHAPEPMHGRIDAIHHDGAALLVGIPSPFSAVRYHSLLAREPLPAALKATAWTNDGLLMGLAHRDRPLWGVQFHPESICTEFGARLLENFLRLAKPYARAAGWPAYARPASAKSQAGEPRELFARRLAAGHDPAETYETLFGGEELGVWLDSARVDHSARFSFMAGGARAESELITYDAAAGVITVEQRGVTSCFAADFFEYLQARLAEISVVAPDLPFAFCGGWIGYAGYEMKAACGGRSVHRASTPDTTFLLVERFVAADHQTGELYLAYLGPDGEAEAVRWFDAVTAKLAQPRGIRKQEAAEPIEFTASQPRAAYVSRIVESLGFIRDGESYEVCLTNQLKARTDMDPLAYYQRLRQSNPAPYAAFFQLPGLAIACSSPERFLQVTSDGRVETKPIKGTIRRGQTAEEDAALRDQLASDVKSRAENLMIVDLLRNDLGRVCQVGSVRVPGLMQIESYATVHQLVSTITGHLRPDQTAVDCLRAAFPGGSMTGAPKLRTLEVIDALEPEARGVYSGCLGYLSFNGAADFNIVIRTAVFQQGRVSIGVGGAIVALSDPVEEWEEILLKARALLRAFGPYTLHTEDESNQQDGLLALARKIEASMDPLQELRTQLDGLDHELLALLGRRFDICRQIAERKTQLAIPMMQPGRVKVVEERAVAGARQHGYSDEFALALYRLIVGEACRIEDELMARSHETIT